MGGSTTLETHYTSSFDDDRLGGNSGRLYRLASFNAELSDLSYDRRKSGREPGLQAECESRSS